MNEILFIVRPFRGSIYDEPPHEVVPTIDGVPLDRLIADFEQAHAFDASADGYGGLVWEWFRYGPADRYFLPDEEVQGEDLWRSDDRTWVLGCACGEVGCWPLGVRVVADNDAIRWDSFQQPHRKQRDYSDFGPFEFDREQYLGSLAQLRTALHSPA